MQLRIKATRLATDKSPAIQTIKTVVISSSWQLLLKSQKMAVDQCRKAIKLRNQLISENISLSEIYKGFQLVDRSLVTLLKINTEINARQSSEISSDIISTISNSFSEKDINPSLGELSPARALISIANRQMNHDLEQYYKYEKIYSQLTTFILAGQNVPNKLREECAKLIQLYKLKPLEVLKLAAYAADVKDDKEQDYA